MLSYISAADNETTITPDDQVKKAYDCLQTKVDDKECDKLSSVEAIFTLMGLGDCKNEVWDYSDNDKCWPKGKCDIKETAQAVLALDKLGENTDDAKEWLLNQKIVPEDLIWYLQIENDGDAECTITYDSKDYLISIGEDKKISKAAGSCLTLSEPNYWLTVSPTCYDKEFSISCDKDFLTSFLFKKRTSPTIHVVDKVYSTVGGSQTDVKIDSYCFSEKGKCDYGGSLWATAVLGSMGEEIGEFVPYLMTSRDDNLESFPDPFLYMITNELEYRTRIFNLQINEKYWGSSTERYFDTALALLPFQNEDVTEKENAKDWLLSVQQDDGCWDGGNIKNNAFLLFSIWPRGYDLNDDGEIDVSDNDCKLSGYYCMSAMSCGVDNLLLSYGGCGSVDKCCSTPKDDKTCSDLNGEVCGSNEYCQGGSDLYSSDTNYNEICCVGGTCTPKVDTGEVSQEDLCENNWGTCEETSCVDGYRETTVYSCEGDKICCVQDKSKVEPIGKKYWWLWLLFILIILAVLGIIYREKIKEYIKKYKEKGKPTTNEQRKGPGFPSYPRTPTGFPQRKIIPKPSHPIQRPLAQRPKPKSPKELDDVLSKLKEMSR